MKFKYLYITAATLILIAFYILPAFSQAGFKELLDDDFKNPQRPPAVFEHDQHNQQAKLFDCSVCHHVYKNGEKIKGAMSVGQECSQCHDVKGEKGLALREAYHYQCINCHQEKNEGPLMCGECHVR